jgi:hypothetical protein
MHRFTWDLRCQPLTVKMDPRVKTPALALASQSGLAKAGLSAIAVK